jgi:predicted lysophospholipase L1 biosynthesis ABC-type transport system permease subunit
MTFLRYFCYVLGAALLSAVIGGAFAFLVALISPEFVKELFTTSADAASLPRYAAAVGMIWGVFIGAAVMGFCLGLVTLVQIAKVFTKKKAEDETKIA